MFLVRGYLRMGVVFPQKENLDYLMLEQMIHGDVDEVVNRLNMFRDETGDFGTLVLMGYDWDDKEAWLHSMDLFVNEVIPALNS